MTQKVLTAQLRDMEDKGLLTRKVYAEVPPRVEHTLTDTGCGLSSFWTPWWPEARTISRKMPPLRSGSSFGPRGNAP